GLQPSKGAKPTHAGCPQIQLDASCTSNCVACTPPSVVDRGGDTTLMAGCEVNQRVRSRGSGIVRCVPGSKTFRIWMKSRAPAKSDGPRLMSIQSLVSLFPVQPRPTENRSLGWNA